MTTTSENYLLVTATDMPPRGNIYRESPTPFESARRERRRRMRGGAVHCGCGFRDRDALKPSRANRAEPDLSRAIVALIADARAQSQSSRT